MRLDRRVYIGAALILAGIAGAAYVLARPTVWSMAGLLAYWCVLAVAAVAIVARNNEDRARDAWSRLRKGR